MPKKPPPEEQPPADGRFTPGRWYTAASGRRVRWPAVKTVRGIQAWLQREVKKEVHQRQLHHMSDWFVDKPGRWPPAEVDAAMDILFNIEAASSSVSPLREVTCVN